MAASFVERKATIQELSLDLSNGSSSLFHRKIEFHPARKPYKGFNNGAGDFRIETLNPTSSSDSVRTGFGSVQNGFFGKKSDQSEVSESGLDPELSFGITFKSIGAGLQNMGNTCYLNSVLQCLTYTEPLAAYLQSGKHKSSCRIAGFCALCAIQKHVSRALQSTGRCLSPNEIVSNLKCISRNFRSWRQEDAHEYMVNLLESMHKCCLPSGVPSESPSAYEKSLVHKIFGGSLRSQVKCLQCSFGSNKYDPFLDLSLEINKVDSVDKALSHFTSAELLDGGEREYMCQRCKQKVRARKQLTVHKPPYVLTIHLKRFRAHDPGQKIDKKVNFGPTLDLKPFVSEPQGGNVKYTLYGVLVHSGGSTRSGHYYCFVRTSTGIWHSLDDNRVSPVSEKRVLEQKAYMLFYVRDRSNIVPRKPVDVSMKENIKAKEGRMMNCSAPNQILSKPGQNGSIDVRSNSIASSPIVAQKDVVGGVLPRVPLSKEGSGQPKLQQSTVPSQSKDSLSEKASLPLQTSGLGSKSVDLPCNNDDACKLDNSTTQTISVSTNELNDNGCSAKDTSVSLLASGNMKEIPIFSATKDVSKEVQNNPASQVEALKMNSPEEAGTSLEKNYSIEQPDPPSCEPCQVASTINGNALDTKTGDSILNSVAGKSVTLPDSSNVTSRSAHVEASSNCKSRKKLKKKTSKPQIASMNFGSSFFLKVALQKKKKHKISRKRPLCSKNLSMELLEGKKSLSSEIGPSTSGKTNTVFLNSIHSQRKEVKPVSRIEANGSASKDVNNPDEHSLKSYGSLLVRDDQLSNHPSFKSPINQLNGHKPDSQIDCKGDRTQNDMLCMLTQGLGETIVARWDDVELPPQNVEREVESVSIGYIGDEWDEEYDRGKRKKVRQAKCEFGGNNPFQEFASNKAKKAKIDRSRFGNQPFRI